MAKYFNESELTFKTLLAGAQQSVVTDVVTIKPGAYVIGTVGTRGTSGFEPVAATDTTADGVLLQDTAADDKQALIAYTGEFLLGSVVCSDNQVPSEALIAGAAAKNIYFRKQSNKEAK